MIRLALAEDHQSLIDGIKLLMEYEDNIEIVGATNDGTALIELVRLKQPNIVITDIRMPKLDGISATKIIKTEFPHIKVLAFTMFEQKDAIQQMLEAGASGYLLKNSPLKNILTAVNHIANGYTYYDTNIDVETTSACQNSVKGNLTKRQREILALIAQGKTSREIADELCIGTYTVDTHRKNMIRILGLKGKGELLRYAVEKKYAFQ